MNLKEIGISVSRTFNLGNFESLRVEASASASVDDGDAPETIRGQLLDEVRLALREAHAAFKPKETPR